MASSVRAQPLEPLTASAGMVRYQVGGFILALLVALIAFGALWVLNGLWTVQFFARHGVPVAGGMAIHLTISVVEQHLWRARRVLRWLLLDDLWTVIRWGVYPLILLVGVIDVGTGAYELIGFADSRGWPTAGMLAITGWTVLAEAVAVAAEPLLVATLVILWRVITRGIGGAYAGRGAAGDRAAGTDRGAGDRAAESGGVRRRARRRWWR